MTKMTRKEFKQAKLKRMVKKIIFVGGMLITVFTYTFSNGSVLEVQAKGQEVIESNILVQKGHTLSYIAEMTGTTIQGIQELNHLKNDMIYEGQTLRLPTSAEVIPTLPKTKEEAQKKNTANATSSSTYLVKKGDNLTKISQQTGVSIGQLKAFNNLKDDLIFEGKTLKLTGEEKQKVKQETKQTISSSTEKITPTSEILHEDEGEMHIVKSGETLYRVALLHGLTVEQLKEMNDLHSDVICVNAKLIVSPEHQSTVKKTTSNSIIQLPAIVYTVQAGDTFYDLEQKFDISRNLIMEWNQKKYANLIIGERLVIFGEAYQALAEFNGSVDNHSVEVEIDEEEEVLQVDYDHASDYDQYIGKQKSIQWIETPDGEQVLVNVN